MSVKKARMQHISKYVTDLRHITGYYSGWVSETNNDLEQYCQILQNDAAIKHAMHLLALMSAGDTWAIEGPSVVFNMVAKKAFNSIERFAHVRKSLVEKSVLFGLAVQKKVWGKKVFREYGNLSWDVPIRLKEVDRRRMRIEREYSTKDRNKVYMTVWSPKYDQYVILEDKRYIPDAEFALQDYLWMWHEFEELSPMYRGLGECLYTLAYIKQHALQYWADLAEHFGTPFIVASIDAAKAAYNMAVNSGGGAQNFQAIVDRWLDILENMKSRHVAVKPDHDALDIHEAGTMGNNILKELIDYVDDKIQLLILGSELVTQTSDVGSYATAKIHQGATTCLVVYSRNNVNELLSRDLLYDFYLRNRMNFCSLGLRLFPEGTALRIGSTREDKEWQIEAKVFG